jgi:hypothetical protein
MDNGERLESAELDKLGFGALVHLDIELGHPGQGVERDQVVLVAVDMFEVDLDGDTALQDANSA